MSCIYEVRCECGENLDFTLKLDSSDDLIIETERCKICMDEAFAEGEKEGKATSE